MPELKTKTTKLIERPPVIVVMGHIDHGKSTLLDYIRQSNVAEKEVGGITQNISAYEVEHNGKRLTFLDTPGHEAFSRLRGRGASVADLAILVVSAEDGVKPQTIEAYKSIQEAKLPVIVAINKIDKEGANLDRARQSLIENEIYLEGFGGDIPSIPISAKTGQGVPELLDMMLLVSELAELKADPNAPAEGTIIEVNRDKEKGISGSLIIKSGTLRGGMFVVGGTSIAPTRLMEDHLGRRITEVTFSSPVKVIGFDSIPSVGSRFYTFPTKKEAEGFIETAKKTQTENKVEADDPNKFVIPIIIKANTSGIIEAIEYELAKLQTEKVGLRVLYKAIGDVNDDDVKIASGKAGSLVIGFDTKISGPTKQLAERLEVEIHIFNIIYKLQEWLETVIKDRTPQEEVEEKKGLAKILRLFSHVKDRQIIGGRVEEGTISLSDELKILRRDAVIGQGKIRELQQAKAKTSSVEAGAEFGAMVESKIEIAAGDKLECFVVVKK